VAEEGFLELINNMLTSGMVPALYTDEEKEGGWLFCCLGWGKGRGGIFGEGNGERVEEKSVFFLIRKDLSLYQKVKLPKMRRI